MGMDVLTDSIPLWEAGAVQMSIQLKAAFQGRGPDVGHYKTAAACG